MEMNNIINKQWKDIPGYEGIYQISEYGDIKCKKILKGSISIKGYPCVHLCTNCITKWFFIHRLVATVFISNSNMALEVHHKDGNKLNNHYSNLEWISKKDHEILTSKKRSKPRQIIDISIIDCIVPGQIFDRNEYLKTLNIFNLPGEIWKDVISYKGVYQVSNLGRLKCLPKPTLFNRGRKEKILRPRRGPKGYILISLYKNGIENYVMLHRLIAQAFIFNTNPTLLNQINHKNGIKDDNRVENLEWSNNSLNQKHAFRMGLQSSRKGVDNNLSRFKECEIKEIRKLFETGRFSKNYLSKMFMTTSNHICRIISKESWSHI